MQKKVAVVEVGPRDGFQNIKEFIPTAFKKEIIDRLVASGIKKIECTSFVSPKAIEQMKDASEVAAYAVNTYPDVEFFALIPNLKGAELAVRAGLKEITPVISLSESHNKQNINRTQEESLLEIKKIREIFPDLKITQDIATVFGCPFEGNMEIKPLLSLISKLTDLGVSSFTLCDTIGVSYPAQVKAVMAAVKSSFPNCEFNIHIHDTRNMGIINSLTALESGADSIQTTLGGLGGCPFAPGASGNTATEDLVYLLNREGYETEIDFLKLLDSANYLHQHVEGNYSGHHINITDAHSDFRE